MNLEQRKNKQGQLLCVICNKPVKTFLNYCCSVKCSNILFETLYPYKNLKSIEKINKDLKKFSKKVRLRKK